MLRIAFATATLCFAGAAAAQIAWPSNTIECAQFHKAGDAWAGTATFDIGPVKHVAIDANIAPHDYVLAGYDLYEVIENKCGKK